MGKRRNVEAQPCGLNSFQMYVSFVDGTKAQSYDFPQGTTEEEAQVQYDSAVALTDANRHQAKFNVHTIKFINLTTTKILGETCYVTSD